MTIRGETPRSLNAAQECAVLRASVRDGVAPPGVRRRLAVLLNQLDAFDQTVALLSRAPAGTLGYDEQLLLADACCARGTDDDARALDAAGDALALATTDQERAAALTTQGKLLFRMSQPERARAVLREALELDRSNADACERLTRDLLSQGDAAAALALTDALAAHGVRHARLFEARATALALLDQIDAARDVLSLDTLLHEQELAAPPEWPTIAAFNAALADELLAHPAIRFERHGTASVDTWRIDSLVAGDGPLARLLVGEIAAAAQRHVDALGDVAHPWLAAAPPAAVVRAWCVMTDGSGYERWHLHPGGWMSGVYYVRVPDAVTAGTDSNGCLMLGMSDHLIGADKAAAIGYRRVRPRPGLLALFPSHAYHRTFSHGASGKRIGVAFDIGPA